MHPKTIKVKPWGEGQGDFVLINEDEFNADFHELSEGTLAKSEKDATAAEIKAQLDELKVEYKGNASKADLKAMLEVARAANS